ncbi:nucleotide exchange factor GrpE [Candidatus Woesearchaeota archaeon]|nr:nucleotide exchange factor GrpE [Candidatus Woesearchaeota archaeon]
MNKKVEEKSTQEQELKKRLEEQEKQLVEYLDTLRRLQAEFENYMKRTEKEKQEFVNFSNHKLITKLLTVADSFQKAIEVIKDEETLKGVKMIEDQFHKTLKEEGLEIIQSHGQKFDPYKHEVIDMINGEEEDVVVHEIQRGYILKNKVLRPSKVRISKVGGKNE